MKKWVLLAIVLLLAATTFGKDYEKLRIGIEGAYPPFSTINAQGEPEGFDIDIAKALCKEMGAECTLIPQDWDGIIPALLARKYDAIVASMSITEERKQKVAFTDKYYQTPARFVAKKGTFKDVSKDSLEGKTVGVQRATVTDKFLTGVYGDAVTIKRYSTFDEAVLDLTIGRADLFIADAIVTSDGFLKKPQGKDYEFVGPSFADPQYFGEGIGIAIRKQDKDLVEKFNQAIKAIRANGVYQKINDQYFDIDIYGE